LQTIQEHKEPLSTELKKIFVENSLYTTVKICFKRTKIKHKFSKLVHRILYIKIWNNIITVQNMIMT